MSDESGIVNGENNGDGEHILRKREKGIMLPSSRLGDTCGEAARKICKRSFSAYERFRFPIITNIPGINGSRRNKTNFATLSLIRLFRRQHHVHTGKGTKRK